MNMEINLLPDELKPKPLVKPQTLMVIVAVLILGFGCFHFYSDKAGKQAEADDIQSKIAGIEQEITMLKTNSEAVALKDEVAAKQVEKNKYDTMNSDYETFTDARVEWGYVTSSVRENVPWGVSITSITQGGTDGKVVTVQGIANNFERETAYMAKLEADRFFSGVKTLSWEASTGQFSLSFDVQAGGGS